jgi:glutamate racemase
MFRKLTPTHVNLIDGNVGTANNLKRTLEKLNRLDEGNGVITYYNSGIKVEDAKELEKYKKLFQRLDTIFSKTK